MTAPAVPDVRTRLDEARRRTLALLDLPEDTQRDQVSPLMSPMVWDLAHVGNYEELWLLRALDGRGPIDPTLDDLYNAFEHPRWERPSLPILGPAEARAYLARVRREVLDLLDRLDDGGAPTPEAVALLDGDFVYGMVIQHEHQHDETLLATRQLLGDQAPPVPGAVPAPPPARAMAAEHSQERDMVALGGGSTTLGTDDHPWAYDNERPAHVEEVAPFALDRHPVTAGAYRDFVLAGGYRDPSWWTPAGWAWRVEAGLEHPEFWSADLEAVLRFGTWRTLVGTEPVQHVSWYEADAYARWAGKRLPTEAEWEHAATTRSEGGRSRYPWGDCIPTEHHANLGQRHDGPAPVGTYSDGASAAGVSGLIGDVWEWTASVFSPYPGFRAFPYREYSEVFFGTCAAPDDPGADRQVWRVLRGGSWATHPLAIRGTFRNWDYPIRRQIFAGFRCASDLAGEGAT